MTKAELDIQSRTDLKKANWVIRGPLSASECFHCGNKIDQEHRDTRVAILCLNHCHPISLSLEEKNARA